MASYSYPANTISFGVRDGLAPGDPDKIVSGANFDLEFNGITSGKLDKSGTDFDGTIADTNATVDGGTY